MMHVVMKVSTSTFQGHGVPCTLLVKSYKCLVVQDVLAGSECVSRVGQPGPGGARRIALVVIVIRVPQGVGQRSARAAIPGTAKSRQPSQTRQRADMSFCHWARLYQPILATIPEPSAPGHGACNIRVLSATPPPTKSSYQILLCIAKNSERLTTVVRDTATLPCDKIPGDCSGRPWHSRRNISVIYLLILL